MEAGEGGIRKGGVTWTKTSSSAAGFLLSPTREVPLICRQQEQRRKENEKETERGRVGRVHVLYLIEELRRANVYGWC